MEDEVVIEDLFDGPTFAETMCRSYPQSSPHLLRRDKGKAFGFRAR